MSTMSWLLWCCVLALGLAVGIFLVCLGMVWGAHIFAKAIGLDKIDDWFRSR